MSWLLFTLLAFFAAIAIGCAVAIGSGVTACVDIDSRSALVVDTASSAPTQDRTERFNRAPDNGGVNCKTVLNQLPRDQSSP